GRDGARLDGRGVGADVRLGQGEGGDRALREAREVSLLLLLGPEELQRLGDADGLVGGQQGGDGAVDAGDEADGPRVAVLREAKPTVLPRDLDAEGAHLPEAVDDVRRHLAGAVDLVAVHLVLEERLQGLEEGPGPRLLLRIRPRVGMDEVETELAVEQVTNEALRPPFRFAGGLGDLAGLAGTDLRFRHGSDSTRPRARIPGGLNAAEGRPPRHLPSAPWCRRRPDGPWRTA